jgi:hypothetical protein
LGSRVGHPAGVDGLLDRGHQQLFAQLGHPSVSEVDDLGKIVPGVDVHDGKGKPTGPERFLGQPQEDGRVLAPAEQQHRAFAFGRHFPHDEHGMGLEQVEVVHAGRGGGRG